MSEYRTPMSRALGLGSAKEGVGHWWSQRLTSVALIPLTALAILPLGHAIGSGQDVARATYADPINALVAILFIAVSFRHLHQGLQVVIEDYVHKRPAQIALLFGSGAFCAIFGLAGVLGVAKLALGG
jgi:succinate dehydrogenase / fumarate reductase membrane anchor subunit